MFTILSLCTLGGNKLTTVYANSLNTSQSQIDTISTNKAKQYISITNKINELELSETYYFKVKTVGLLDSVITWKSNDTSVATVSKSGKIKPIAAGTVTITATDRNSGKKSSCTLRIRPKASSSSYFTYRIVNSKAIITDYKGPSNLKKVVIPKKLNGFIVTKIDNYSFTNSDYIQSIDFPETIHTIGNYAFYGCRSIKTITLPSKLTTLGEGAFANCTSLSSCSFPKSMKHIGDYAFNGCSVLTDVSLPTTCNFVGKLVFSATPLDSLTNLLIAASMSSDIFLTKTEKQVYQEMKDILSSLIIPDDSKVEQIKKIHDWLILNTTYDTRVYSESSMPKESYEAVGLIKNKTAVCSGYAEAFQIFMELLDIESKIVTGKADGVNHAWNMVQLKDEWYHIDVTWDDPLPDKNTVSYNYFLITDTMMAKDHSWNTKSYPACEGIEYMYYVYEDYLCTTQEQVRSSIRKQKKENSDWIMIVCPSSIKVQDIIFEFCTSYSYFEPYTVGSYIVYRIQLK